MPQFEVSGRGKDTGRKRKRKYNAENETEVRSIAESEGTIVDSIVELPPEPASEKQLEYAGILGITVPENPTKEELSYLISQKVDDPASEAQLYCFKQQGLQLGKYQYASSNNVVHAIKNKLGDNATHELARWYIYSVFRYIKKEKWQVPDNNLIQKEKAHGLAEKLISKEDIKKSLLRELEKIDYCFNIIPFKLDSNIDLSPASTRTKVFQEAEKIAHDTFRTLDQYKLQLTDKATTTVQREIVRKNLQKNKGCLSIIVFGFVVTPIGIWLMSLI